MMQQPMPQQMGTGTMPTLPPIKNILSPLDHWAMKEFNGMTADQLQDPADLDKLTSHMLTICDEDVKYWEPRNDRMIEDQRFWELGQKTTPAHLINDEDANEFSDSEEIELNDGYLVVDKLTSMVSGADWSIDVPAKSTLFTDIAQSIENFLMWGERELNQRHALALNASLIRDEAHYACLRGWITGMILPNPNDTRVPWTHVLEDPLFVYPRYSRDKLIRVTHRYTITALEAREDFPEALDYLIHKDDEEEIEITTYYDNKYKMVVIGTPMPVGNARDSATVQPLIKHGYRDIDGEPINPWIIITPRGTPTRRVYAKGNSKREHDEVVSMIGLSVLHPIKGIIEDLERLVSQMHTEVAKGVNPPKVIYYDGVNKPEQIDLGIGAENYLLLNQQKVEILNTTAMKPDTSALLQIYSERLQKGSVPSVLYGQGATGMAGYAISMLSKGAQDVVTPLMEGMKLYRELRFRRMLEMYVSQPYSAPVDFPSYDPNLDRMLSQGAHISPQDIMMNGVYIEVRYDNVVPQERAAMLSAAVGAVGAGVLPLYDALKDYAGIRDPRAALVRIAEGVNYRDPEVLSELKIVAAEMSGNDMLKEAVMRVQQKRMIAMQNGQVPGQPGDGGSPPGTPGVPSQAVPPNMQQGAPSVPANQDKTTAVVNQLRNASASVNAGNGASPPNPQ